MAVDGTADARFVAVREAFTEVVEDQTRTGTGAALAVWYAGEWVVDLWGGYADAAHTKPWRRDSIVMPYSATKPFAAVCALLLVDRGRIDLDEPLSTYWPQMTAETTMRQVLAHRSGHVVLDREAPQQAFYDWDLMCRLLAEQRPTWHPGTEQGESALFYGHLIGEVVRRVDGRPLGQFLRDEVTGPLGIDFVVGVREDELGRVVELTGYDAEFRRRTEEGPELLGRALGNPPGALDPDVVNSRRWRTAEIPAVNGHGTARGLAGLYVALQEGRLLSGALVAEATAVAGSGRDLVMGDERAWGLGFGVDSDGYGMGGLGGSFGGWSNVGRYAIGFVTGVIGDYDRAARVENAVRACLGVPAL
jgi:CubicO group peptidase (beta-lactamase class C family)